MAPMRLRYSDLPIVDRSADHLIHRLDDALLDRRCEVRLGRVVTAPAAEIYLDSRISVLLNKRVVRLTA